MDKALRRSALPQCHLLSCQELVFKYIFFFAWQISNLFFVTPKFAAITSFGVWASQSVSWNVLFSENDPSSNTSRNSAPSSSAWIECGRPDGKYQRSPSPTSSIKLRPFSSTIVTLCASVNHISPFCFFMPVQLANGAHFSRIFTDARFSEIGSSRTVTSRAYPPFSNRL